MGTTTKIQWTDHTFNPWLGCSRVSEGCRHCYAETLVQGRMGLDRWGSAPRVRTKGPWRDVLKWNRDAEKAGVRRRVFCASLADVFEDAPGLDAIRADLWPLIEKCTWLDWQLLTKRPENILRMVPHDTPTEDGDWWINWPKHVWIGTSVENQETAQQRIPFLLQVPAKIRFLSCEPLLGPTWPNYLKIGEHRDMLRLPKLADRFNPMHRAGRSRIEWVIVGGESGPDARQCRVEWIRTIVQQCSMDKLPCFVKQMGSVPTLTPGEGPTATKAAMHEREQALTWPEGTMFGNPTGDTKLNGLVVRLKDRKGGDMDEWPDDLRVRQFPR